MIDDTFINLDPGAGAVPFGEICMANESRYDAAWFSQPLTTFSVGGWDNDPLTALLEFIAPACPVSRKFNFRRFDSADEFLIDDNDEDIRALGADFARAQASTAELIDSHTDNKGLVIALDADRMAEDPGYKNREIKRLTQRLMRCELVRAVNAVDASAVSTSKTWSGTADPDQEIAIELDTARSASGVRPNRILIGNSAWTKRQTTYRGQNTAGGHSSAALNEGGLGSYLNADVNIAQALYRSSTTAALQALIGSAVYMFNASAGLGAEDPSNIKRFVSKVGGTTLQVFEQQVSAKKYEVTICHYSKLVVTSTLGVRKLAVS